MGLGTRYKTGAIIRGDNDCYRYELWRLWDDRLPIMAYIMLNPSTADHMTNDPTIRRCMSFAKRERHGGIRVVNLFAYRATDPKVLRDVEDPVGPRNDEFIMRVTKDAHAKCGLVVAAWGAGPYMGTKGHIHVNDSRADKVLQMLSDAGIPVHCLGTTRDGHPCHPVRLSGSTEIVPYEVPAHAQR